MLFRRRFHRLFALSAIAGWLIVCAAISKAVSSASSAAAASAPFARPSTLLLLWCAVFRRRTLRGLLSCFILFVAHHNRRHDFLCLYRAVLSFSAADLDDGRGPGTCHGFANGICVFIFFHQEVGNIEECVALQPNVHKGGLHARQHAGDASLVN